MDYVDYNVPRAEGPGGFLLRKEDLMGKLKLLTVCATLASLWACGSPEQATIDQFFRAAHDKDSTTVALMSAVSPPAGVESWKVVEVTSRSTAPFTLPDAVQKYEAAEKERKDAAAVREQFSKDNKEALEEIIPKLRDTPDYKFRGKLGEIQEQWAKMLDERTEKERAYQEAKRTRDQLSSVASKSVLRQVDVGAFEGSIAVTQAMVNLKLPDHGELPFKITLEKYDVSEPGSDRVEPARWIISDIEGATPEAQAAAAPPANPIAAASESPAASRPARTEPAKAEPAKAEPAKAEPAKAADVQGAGESDPSGRKEANYLPRELRGAASVQILAPKPKIEGGDVVTTIQVRNASKDWITLFTVTEHWYDQQGNAVGVGSATHKGRFMPGEVIEMEVRTPKKPNFFQDQFEFSHANGTVSATKVDSFPKES